MTFILKDGKKILRKFGLVLGIWLAIISLVITGNISCKKKVEEETFQEVGSVLEFEGVVKVGVGKYFFIPGAQGIDMVIVGQLEGGDASSLVGKEVKVKGEFSVENPSVVIVDSIELKEGEKDWRNIYIRTEDVVLDDYLDPRLRDNFKLLRNLDYKKKEDWEGVGKGKVYGRLEKTSQNSNSYQIIVLNDDEEEVGKVIVDSITDFALYYLKKLRLFDKFWFYLNIKDTVDWITRRKTKELFHADVVFAGLY